MATIRARARVIVVDDDPLILETVEALLEDHFDITAAHSGREALAIARTGSFDMVCTDHLMAGMSGVELILSLGELGLTMGAVLVTGLAAASSDHQDLRAPDGGAVRLVLKPYDPETLVGAIEHATMMARTPTAVPSPCTASNRLDGGTG